MNSIDLAKYFDHTALKPETTQNDIDKLCNEARQLGAASVCVNPMWVPTSRKLLDGSDVMAITVIGFPLGSNETSTKVYETRQAISSGAQEIDMVLSVGLWKSGFKDLVRKDICDVLKACNGIPLKVIFETALLNQNDIFDLSVVCASEGVDFVKTSTGFSTRGASVEDLKSMKSGIVTVSGARTKIKASGGIRTLKDALTMIEAGADRLGASATVGILNEFRNGSKISQTAVSQSELDTY